MIRAPRRRTGRCVVRCVAHTLVAFVPERTHNMAVLATGNLSWMQSRDLQIDSIRIPNLRKEIMEMRDARAGPTCLDTNI